MRFDFLRSISVVVLSVFSLSSVSPAFALRAAGLEENAEKGTVTRRLLEGNRGNFSGGLQKNSTSGLEEIRILLVAVSDEALAKKMGEMAQAWRSELDVRIVHTADEAQVYLKAQQNPRPDAVIWELSTMGTETLIDPSQLSFNVPVALVGEGAMGVVGEWIALFNNRPVPAPFQETLQQKAKKDGFSRTARLLFGDDLVNRRPLRLLRGTENYELSAFTHNLDILNRDFRSRSAGLEEAWDRDTADSWTILSGTVSTQLIQQLLQQTPAPAITDLGNFYWTKGTLSQLTPGMVNNILNVAPSRHLLAISNGQVALIRQGELESADQDGAKDATNWYGKLATRAETVLTPQHLQSAGLEETPAQVIAKQKAMAVIAVPSVQVAAGIGAVVAYKGIIPEITFRGNEADVLQAINALFGLSSSKRMPVAAGSVLTADQVEKAVRAGAKIIVSPGLIDEVILKAQELGVLVIPGVASMSEAKTAVEVYGLSLLKFFPFSFVDQADFIKSIKAPLPPNLQAVVDAKVTWGDSGEVATFTKILEFVLSNPTASKQFQLPKKKGLEALHQLGVNPAVANAQFIPTGGITPEMIPQLIGKEKIVAVGLSIGGDNPAVLAKADAIAKAVAQIAGAEEGVVAVVASEDNFQAVAGYVRKYAIGQGRKAPQMVHQHFDDARQNASRGFVTAIVAIFPSADADQIAWIERTKELAPNVPIAVIYSGNGNEVRRVSTKALSSRELSQDAVGEMVFSLLPTAGAEESTVLLPTPQNSFPASRGAVSPDGDSLLALKETPEVRWATMVGRTEGFSSGRSSDGLVHAQGLVDRLEIKAGFTTGIENELNIVESYRAGQYTLAILGAPVATSARPIIQGFKYEVTGAPGVNRVLTLSVDQNAVSPKVINNLVAQNLPSGSPKPLTVVIEAAAGLEETVYTGIDQVVAAITQPEGEDSIRALVYSLPDGTEQRAVLAPGEWTPAQAVPGAFQAMELRPVSGRVTITISGSDVVLRKAPEEPVIVAPVKTAVKLPLTARLANMFGVFRFSVDATDNISNEFVDYVGSVGGDKGTLNPSSVGKSAETGQMNSLVREFVSSTVRGANLLWQLVKRHVSAVFLPRVETSVELDPTVPSVYALTLDGKNPVVVKKSEEIVVDEIAVVVDKIVVKEEFQAIVGKKTLKPGEKLTPAQARQVHSLMVRQWVAQALEIHRLGDKATVKIGHTKSLTPIMGDWGVRVGLDVLHILSVLGIHRNFTLGFTEEDANLALQADRVVQAELDAVKTLDLQTVSADQVISALDALYTPEIRGDFKNDPLPLGLLDKTSPVILPGQRAAKGYRPAGRSYFSLFASRVDAKVNSAEWKGEFTDDQQKYFGIVNLLYVMVTHYNDQVPWNKAHGQVVIPASLEPKVAGQPGDFYFTPLVGWGYQVVPTASKKVIDAFNARTVTDEITGQERELSEAELYEIAMRTQRMKQDYADKLAAQGPLSPVIDQAAAIDVIAKRFVQEGFYADFDTARAVVESIVTYRQNNPQGYDKMMNQLYPEGDDKFTGPHLLGVQSVNQKIEVVAANRQSAQLVGTLREINYVPTRILNETGSQTVLDNLTDVANLLESDDSAVVALSLAENLLIVRTGKVESIALAQADLSALLSLAGPLAPLKVAAQQRAEAEAKTALQNAFGTLPLDTAGTRVYSGPAALRQLSELFSGDVAVIGARYEEGNPASVITTPRNTARLSVSANPNNYLVIQAPSGQLALVRKEELESKDRRATAEAAARAKTAVPGTGGEVIAPVAPTLLERIVAKVGVPITATVVKLDEKQLDLPSRLWLHNGLLQPSFIAREQITDLPADKAGVVAVWSGKQAQIQSTDLVLLNANTVPSAEVDQWLVGLPADRKPVVLRLSNNDINIARNQNILAALIEIARQQGGYLDVIGMTYDPATQVLSVQA